MSRTDQQFKLRMPPKLRARVEQSAKQANRSLNAEIVTRLQASVPIPFLESESMSGSLGQAWFNETLQCVKRRHKPFCSCGFSQSSADAIKSALWQVRSSTDVHDLHVRFGISFGLLEAYVDVGAISTAHSLNLHRLLNSAFDFAPAQVAS